jgi:hypothetical protein
VVATYSAAALLAISWLQRLAGSPILLTPLPPSQAKIVRKLRWKIHDMLFAIRRP